ncbi:MAG: helix-turn-helix domain-containing protein [Clostridia bacterium]|nr:helix-turn-helix domain-containing protein [Clostridia bacterium]
MATNKNRTEVFEKPDTDADFDKENFFIDYRTIGYDTEYIETLHYHKYYELELICEGEGEHKINDRSFRVSRGYISLLKKLDCHVYHFKGTEQISLYSMSFSEKCISPKLFQKLISCYDDTDFFLTDEEYNQIKSLLDILYQQYKKRTEDFLIIRDSCLNVILSLLFEKVSMTTVYSETMHNLKRALLYLGEHFSDADLSLTKVAGAVGLSQNYLGLIFKKKLKISYIDYIKQLRLTHSIRLLKQGELSLDEIAEKCGFNSKSYYIAIFKKQYGVTPKKYKEQL